MNKLLTLYYTSTHILDAHLLLWGDDSLTNTQNTEIFKTVQVFLSDCGRISKNV